MSLFGDKQLCDDGEQGGFADGTYMETFDGLSSLVLGWILTIRATLLNGILN